MTFGLSPIPGPANGPYQPQSSQDLSKSAKMLEAHLVFMAFKTMDEGETPLLGGAMPGFTHFKDEFFQLLAEEVVRQKSLGFEANLSQNRL